MRGIAAGRVITVVAHIQTGWDRAVRQFPRQAVCVNLPAVVAFIPQRAIARRNSATLPYPAPIGASGSVYARPQAVTQRNARGHAFTRHATELALATPHFTASSIEGDTTLSADDRAISSGVKDTISMTSKAAATRKRGTAAAALTQFRGIGYHRGANPFMRRCGHAPGRSQRRRGFVVPNYTTESGMRHVGC
jgi:hypothetical protein